MTGPMMKINNWRERLKIHDEIAFLRGEERRHLIAAENIRDEIKNLDEKISELQDDEPETAEVVEELT